MAASRNRYDELRLPRSEKKAFDKEYTFKAWGTEVCSSSGRVGCPVKKLRQIEELTSQLVLHKHATKKALQKLVGLYVHPFMHRRECMSIFHHTYMHIENLPNAASRKIPQYVQDELITAALLLPMAAANVRLPVSVRVSATDASLEGGGYQGVCDKDGCDFNSWRLGDRKFYGRGSQGFKVDSRQKVTVVTQFLTEGDDDGDLIDIRRFYVQDGKVIPNSNVSIAGVHGDSITDKVCSDMKQAFGDVDDFNLKGGLKTMGDALDRGMVLVMSLWDDAEANMLWLDSDYPTSKSPTLPGVNRGPCNQDTGKPGYLRAKYPDARVQYSNIKAQMGMPGGHRACNIDMPQMIFQCNMFFVT
eukprot:Skav235006  [mRNA]  locus=scaffold276:32697:41515:+ [translate_table: standard]